MGKLCPSCEAAESLRNRFDISIGIAAAIFLGSWCAVGAGQQPLFDAAPPLGMEQPVALPAGLPALGAADAANIDGCQVIARIDGQIVQACEVLWHVNRIIEQNQDKIPPEQVGQLRQELVRRELAALLDRKLLYKKFVDSVPPENLPHIAEKLREPFEQREVPELMKRLKVSSSVELEKELARLGSSMADARQAFNEKAVASEWLRTKVKVSEEVSPDEMLEYYQSHLTNYDEPARVRWEELTVHKSRFKSPAEAYAEMANMGNEVWQRSAGKEIRGPAFVEVAKARSDGFKAQDDGGQHDWTTQGALKVTVVDEALFAKLQVGQMSPILETPDAFYIVRVLERKAAGRQSFADVQAKIREDLKEERFQTAVQAYIGQLRNEARIWTVFTGDVTADELLGRKPDETTRR